MFVVRCRAGYHARPKVKLGDWAHRIRPLVLFSAPRVQAELQLTMEVVTSQLKRDLSTSSLLKVYVAANGAIELSSMAAACAQKYERKNVLSLLRCKHAASTIISSSTFLRQLSYSSTEDISSFARDEQEIAAAHPLFFQHAMRAALLRRHLRTRMYRSSSPTAPKFNMEL